MEEIRDRRASRLAKIVTVAVVTNAAFVAVDIGIRLFQLLGGD